eukprot:TRINITY_DN2265_c0_g1_i1.p1 TRINITY_DN2265_c0_g1~~TRINITY_DN2265_c0_g1_i1.p1  ORF type:complete len:426 (+),score=82.38 TRINITY_DN2265_c0_g1_i1:125-1402(+)
MPLNAGLLQRVSDNDATLSTLSLWQCGIETGDFTRLCKALKRNTHLRHLLLWNTQLQAEDLRRLADALRLNKGLAQLDLRVGGVGPEGGRILAPALPSNRALVYLNLAHSGLADDGVRHIARVLPDCRTLRSLSLAGNNIASDGAIALFDALLLNASIATLNLADNFVGNRACPHLAKLLVTNQVLTEINLNNNRIGDKGAQQISESMAQNVTVCALHLEQTLNEEGEPPAGVPAREDPVPWALIAAHVKKNQKFSEIKNHSALGDIATQARIHVMLDSVTSGRALPAEYYREFFKISAESDKRFKPELDTAKSIEDTMISGIRAMESDDLVKAHQIFTTALSYDAKNTGALLYRAMVSKQMGEFPSAIADLERVVDLNPNSTAGFVLMSECYERTQSPQRARRLQETANAIRTGTPANEVVPPI